MSIKVYALEYWLNDPVPIPKETRYKGVKKPRFLDKVKTKFFVESFTESIHEGSIEYIQKHFDIDTSNKYRIPEAARCVGRVNNSNPDEIYYVIGTSHLCEGEIKKGYGEPNYFVQKRRHPVAIVTNGLNRTEKVLLIDLEYIEESL